jgi:hypothetical protein
MSRIMIHTGYQGSISTVLADFYSGYKSLYGKKYIGYNNVDR